MDRLTHKRSNGIKTGYWSPEKKDALVERLAEYENTGLTPQEIYKLKADGFMEILGTIFGEEKHGQTICAFYGNQRAPEVSEGRKAGEP